MEPLSYRRGWVAVGCLFFLSAMSAGAELLASEDFEYGGDAVAPMNGGDGWAGPWKQPDGDSDATLDLREGDLDPMAGSGSGHHVSPHGHGHFRLLSNEAAGRIARESKTNGEIWISFTARQTTGTWGSVTLWNSGCDDLADKTENYSVVIGRNPFDGGNWSWSDITSVGVAATAAVPTRTAVRYVMRLDYGEGSTEASMFLFTDKSQVKETIGDCDPAGKAAARIQDKSGNRPVFDRIRISGSGDMVMDSIRIGTGLTDVIK